MNNSIKRVEQLYFKRTKTARKYQFTQVHIQELHKELLIWTKNVNKKAITIHNFTDFRREIMAWGKKISTLGAQIRDDLDGLKRQKRAELREGEISQQEFDYYVPQIEDLQQDVLKVWNMERDLLNIPEPNRTLEIAPSTIIDFMRERNTPEAEIQKYLLSDEGKHMMRSQDVRDQESMEAWYTEHGKKWVRKVQRTSNIVKKFLTEYVNLLSSMGLAYHRSDMSEEVTSIEGLRTVMINFGDSSALAKELPKFQKAMNIFKTNAKKRLPLMLSGMLPIKVHWSYQGISTQNQDAAGYYDGKVITITPLGLIQKTPSLIAHVIAHEQGHHIWQTYLSSDKKKFWSQAMFGDYKGKLDIKEIIALMEKHRIRSIHSEKWIQVDPVLYIQLQTLHFTKPDIYGESELLGLLDKGITKLTVPKNPITGYAQKNNEEAFCEAVGRFVTYGRKAVMPLVMKWLSTILPINKNASIQVVATRYLFASDENVPTKPELWEKCVSLAKGTRSEGGVAKLTIDGKEYEAPNDGKGYERYPSAYANGWALNLYSDLGGGWKKAPKKTESENKKASVQSVLEKYARGKAKKDVGNGGLDEWFSGHGQGKSKSDGEATWGDWVAISPVKKTITKDDGKKKTYEPGDIIGPCGDVSSDDNWKSLTNNGKSPFKCMPRKKVHQIPKGERAELAKNKQKAEKDNNSSKPTNTPTFQKKDEKKKD